ncbi:unnamed protein product [Auanema sp. JU1783]|nr:unnamed protein product [Auanema sp. JU1783]
MSKVESQTRSSMRIIHKSISKAVQDMSSSQIAQARMLSAQSMLPSLSMHPSAANMLQKSLNVIPIQAQSFGPSDTNTTSTQERSKDLKNYENCTSTC